MLWPGLGYWPVLLALLPWAARLAASRFPFKRTAFDLPLALFLGTALVGVWAAYNREAAWFKFWMLVTALLVFYALAAQPSENLEAVAGILSLSGVLLAGYFLLSFDWSSQPEDLDLIEQVATIWAGIRPSLQLVVLLPNTVGGILAMLLPISVVPAALKWQARQYLQFGLSIAAVGVILIGLFMTSSRGAWLALIAASAFWLLWKASETLLRQRRISRLRLFSIVPVLAIATVALLLWVSPGGALAAVDRLPGLPSGESRLNLARSTLYLISDYPWTGAGLASFGGVYSQYINVIPFKFYDYGHNLYLDLAVEQGVFATLLGLVIFSAAGWYYLHTVENNGSIQGIRLLAAAGFTSLLAILLHGLMDDALYGMGSTPFLFVLPGLAVAVSTHRPVELALPRKQLLGRNSLALDRPRVSVLSLVLLLVVLLTIFLSSGYFRSSWYANLGAVYMSRLELAGWPLDEWNSNTDTSKFSPSADLFERSLSINPKEVTAQYRLGLIALQGRDFGNAQMHLEQALQLSPDHRGIRKVLGYVYVWNDQPDQGAALLSQVPEASAELQQYMIWWKQEDRKDLAVKAEDMLARLQSKQGNLPENKTSQQ